MKNSRPISPTLGPIFSFSYDKLLFEVHTYVLFRLPYIESIRASSEGAQKHKVRGLKALDRIDIDPDGLISKTLGIPFTGRHMAMLVQWAYDQDTSRLIQPRGPYFEPNLTPDQWLKIAEYMTIPKLDDDIQLVIELTKATGSPKPVSSPIVQQVITKEPETGSWVIPICITFVVLFLGFAAYATVIKFHESILFYKYHRETAETIVRKMNAPGTPRAMLVILHEHIKLNHEAIKNHRQFTDDNRARLLMDGISDAARLTLEMAVNILDMVMEKLAKLLRDLGHNSELDAEIKRTAETLFNRRHGFIRSLTDLAKYILYSIICLVETVTAIFQGRIV